MSANTHSLSGSAILAVPLCLAAAVLTAAPAAAETVCSAPTHERFGETRAFFGDVLAACRPTGYCSIVIVRDVDEGGYTYGQQVRIARPSPGAPYQVELVAASPMPADPVTPAQLTFALTDYKLDTRFSSAEGLGVNEYRIGGDVAPIVDDFKRGKVAKWTYQTEAGPHTASFPLNGVTAGLRWIDCMGERAGAR